MSTYIHGIGASENIDSSGEIVSIAGLDISSLALDGVFNFEHKADVPAQVVGKILKANTEDDHQLYFWNKCKVPFLYVMGELLDDYSDSAREVAGRFRYDLDKKSQNERAMMNFSVEGSKISKEGITVTRSIARKITITILPCNKAAVAEMVSVDPAKPKKSDIDELFKTEDVEIEILKPSEQFLDLLKKEDPKKYADKLGIKPMEKAAPKLAIAGAKPADHARGNQIGITGAGHGVFSHGMVGDYAHFTHKDHAEAAQAHGKAAAATKDPKAQLHHSNKARLHTARSHSMEIQGRARAERGRNLATPKASVGAPTVGTDKKLHDPQLSGKIKPPGPVKKSELAKAMTAGSGLCSPDRLEGGAALAKENVKKNAASTDGPDSEEMEMIKAISAPQGNRHDPGTAAINKPLKSKDSQVGVQNPTNNTRGTLMAKASSNPKLEPKDHKIKDLQRQIDSGTYKPNASKTGEAMLNHPSKPLKGTKVQKSETLQRAEAEYTSWNKREQFETFMKSRMPHLTKGEIQVIGQTMLLQKSAKQESALKKVSQHSFISKKEK